MKKPWYQCGAKWDVIAESPYVFVSKYEECEDGEFKCDYQDYHTGIYNSTLNSMIHETSCIDFGYDFYGSQIYFPPKLNSKFLYYKLLSDHYSNGSQEEIFYLARNHTDLCNFAKILQNYITVIDLCLLISSFVLVH